MLARAARSQLGLQSLKQFVKIAESQVEAGALAAALETDAAGVEGVSTSTVVNKARGSADLTINDEEIARIMSLDIGEGDEDSGDETPSELYDGKKVSNLRLHSHVVKSHSRHVHIISEKFDPRLRNSAGC